MNLKPCPFCGKAPIVFGNGTIECLNDECAGTPCLAPPQGHNTDFALGSDGIEAQILRWNTRSTDSLLKEMAKVLDEMLDLYESTGHPTVSIKITALNILQKYHEQESANAK